VSCEPVCSPIEFPRSFARPLQVDRGAEIRSSEIGIFLLSTIFRVGYLNCLHDGIGFFRDSVSRGSLPVIVRPNAFVDTG
jgi:hypothetical protein